MTAAQKHFYPRSPCGERPTDKWDKNDFYNFYPRSPCGERQRLWIMLYSCPGISIHALLAESDVQIGCRSSLNSIFLSTLSLRRATQTHPQAPHNWNISIHALLAESDSGVDSCSICSSISIHALLAESDSRHCMACMILMLFLSTLSLRRATAAGR